MFIYPPRPRKGWIHPAQIGHFQGYIAQPKYHGWRVLITFMPNGELRLFNRHGTPLRYRPPHAMLEGLKDISLSPAKFHVLDAELLHFMAEKSVRNTLVLFDILVHDGVHLLGTTMKERYELLRNLSGNPREPEKETGLEVGLKIRPHLWLAPNFEGNLAGAYRKHVRPPLIEGLILKNPKGRLQPGTSEENNGFWQIRVGIAASKVSAA